MNLSKQVEVQTMVSCPNVLLEFNSFHIKQIVCSCLVLVTLRDVMDVVEIWRKQHSIAVMHVIAEVFGDIDTIELPAVDNNAGMSLLGLTGHKCRMTCHFYSCLILGI